jgi:hypothetical protein
MRHSPLCVTNINTILSLTLSAGYMVIVSIVGFLEMGGYACRISMFNNAQFASYLSMQCLLIIPPSFLALVQYLTLGKAIRAIQTAHPDRKLLGCPPPPLPAPPSLLTCQYSQSLGVIGHRPLLNLTLPTALNTPSGDSLSKQPRKPPA